MYTRSTAASAQEQIRIRASPFAQQVVDQIQKRQDRLQDSARPGARRGWIRRAPSRQLRLARGYGAAAFCQPGRM
jgi:hypothetical protein